MDVLTLLDRSAVVLGASGIGFAVLGALLYSSRAEIRCARMFMSHHACVARQFSTTTPIGAWTVW